MRRYSYSPTAVERLADLRPTDQELDIIDSEVKTLAKNPRTGYLLPFDTPRQRRRYDVGRFGLIYEFDENSLNVLTVVG